MKSLKRSVNRVSAAVAGKLSPVERALCNKKIAVAASLVAANAAGMTALCAPTGSIATIVNTIGQLVFGFIWLLGGIQLVMGIVAIVKAATDEDQGGDQNGISKGVKKAAAGVLLALGPTVILKLIGLNPLSLGTDLFNGL